MNELSETDKRLNEVLDVEVVEGELLPIVVEEAEENNFPLPTTNPTDERTEDRDIDFDYEYSRSTQRDLIAMGTEAVEGALAVAKESQHPRAYEVAGNMLKNISDIADKLMVLHEKRKSINKENPPPAPTQINVDKGVFVGSTSELLKQIRQDKK
jgi:hypothetical protein